MRTLNELGRFMVDNRLSFRTGFTREGFHVDLSRLGEVVATGHAATFTDAIDEAILDLAKWNHARLIGARS